MAHLWFHNDRAWTVFPLVEGPVAILRNDGPVSVSEGEAPAGIAAALHKRATGAWLLFAPVGTGARVNGLPFPGLRLLRDRDEIRVPGTTLFFSTESLASVEAYPGSSKTAFCPRCRQEMMQGTPAVHCPGCGIWHHEGGDLKCWTYAGACTLCPRKTEISQTYQWMPEAV